MSTKRLKTNIGLFILILFGLVLACRSEAGDLGVLELREVSVDFKQFFDGANYPLITNNGLGQALDKELNLNIKTDILNYFYWDSTIHSMTDKRLYSDKAGQFRLIGLEFGFGLRVSSTLEVGYYHYSQHLLDAEFPWHFPVVDAVQVKIYLYRDKAPRREPLF